MFIFIVTLCAFVYTFASFAHNSSIPGTDSLTYPLFKYDYLLRLRITLSIFTGIFILHSSFHPPWYICNFDIADHSQSLLPQWLSVSHIYTYIFFHRSHSSLAIQSLLLERLSSFLTTIFPASFFHVFLNSETLSWFLLRLWGRIFACAASVVSSCSHQGVKVRYSLWLQIMM